MFDVALINYNCVGRVAMLMQRFESMPLVARVIVVNNSRADQADWSQVDPGEKAVIVSALSNTGYAGGNQLAFDILRHLNSGNHLCVLNADVEVPEDIFDIGLAVLATDERIAQVHFRTENEYGEFANDALKLWGLLHRKRRMNVSTVEDSDYAHGSFFLLRNAALKEIDSLFYEPYFLYWEEVDLSFRLRRENWRIVCSAERVVVRHTNPPHSENRSIYYIVRNAFIFARRNELDNPHWTFFFAKYFLRSIRLMLVSRSLAPLRYYFSGLVDGIRGKSGERQCESAPAVTS